MQLDKKAIDRLLLLDDSSLWGVIRMIASQSGIDLPEHIGKDELGSLREALGGASDNDIEAATQLLARFREGGGK